MLGARQNDMHVIRHDAPFEQLIPVLIKVGDGVRNDLRDARFAHETGAMCCIERFTDPCLDPLANRNLLRQCQLTARVTNDRNLRSSFFLDLLMNMAR